MVSTIRRTACQRRRLPHDRQLGTAKVIQPVSGLRESPLAASRVVLPGSCFKQTTQRFGKTGSWLFGSEQILQPGISHSVGRVTDSLGAWIGMAPPLSFPPIDRKLSLRDRGRTVPKPPSAPPPGAAPFVASNRRGRCYESR